MQREIREERVGEEFRVSLKVKIRRNVLMDERNEPDVIYEKD